MSVILVIPALFVLSASLAADPPEQPNILFIMSDDHAWQAISAYGSNRNTTPNIDRIAETGMRFDRCFVENSICAPSRAAILTGTMSHLHGIRTNAEKFDGTQPTFPAMAQEAGYQTALIGKWHLKSEPVGFDYYERLVGQGHYYRPAMIRNGEKIEHPGYTTEIITDLAIDWLREGRESDKPFVLMVQHKAPHRKWLPGAAHMHDFENETLPEPSTLFDDYSGRSRASTMQEMTIRDHMTEADLKLKMPDHLMRMTAEERALWDATYGPRNEAFFAQNLEGDALVRWRYQRYAKDYLRCIAHVDDSVGALLDELDRQGLADNTIVVYTSDQGWYLGEHGWYDKRWMYEESFRTPLLVRWPGVTKPGSSTNALSQNIDFAPTFLDAVGVAPHPRMQGVSLRPVLAGASKAELDAIAWRDAVYYRYYESNGPHTVPKHEGVRTDRWKLIHFTEIDEVELFDLETDPDELTSLADDPAHATTRSKLEKRLAELKLQYGLPMDN